MRFRRRTDSFMEFIEWLADSDGKVTDERTEKVSIRALELHSRYHRHDDDP